MELAKTKQDLPDCPDGRFDAGSVQHGPHSAGADSRLGGPATAPIEVKLNSVRNTEWCPLCSRYVSVYWGPWPFLRGTYRPICCNCAAERGVQEPYADHLSSAEREIWREHGMNFAAYLPAPPK